MDDRLFLFTSIVNKYTLKTKKEAALLRQPLLFEKTPRSFAANTLFIIVL